jgi:hypothetical protein
MYLFCIVIWGTQDPSAESRLIGYPTLSLEPKSEPESQVRVSEKPLRQMWPSNRPCTIHWKPIMTCIVHPQLSQASTLVTCQTLQLSISSTYGNYLWEWVSTSFSRYRLLGIPGARALKHHPFVKLVGPNYRNSFTKLMPSRHRHKFYFHTSAWVAGYEKGWCPLNMNPTSA